MRAVTELADAAPAAPDAAVAPRDLKPAFAGRPAPDPGRPAGQPAGGPSAAQPASPPIVRIACYRKGGWVRWLKKDNLPPLIVDSSMPE